MSSRGKDIFLNAIEITDLGTREAFIRKACRGDANLRSEVMSLLRSAEHAGEFLETPASVEQFNIDHLRYGRLLFVRPSIGKNWVSVNAPDDILHPDGVAQRGSVYERHLSADGKTMVYDTNWWDSGLGGRDIWMVQRVDRLSE